MKIDDWFIVLGIDIWVMWDVMVDRSWRFVGKMYVLEYDLFGKYFMGEIGGVEG